VGRSFIRSVLWIGGIVGAVLLLLYLFLFDTWVLPGNDPLFVTSILPTLYPEDRLVISRNSSGDLKTGQLARCASPEPGGDWIIGRVMGKAGDNVEINQGRVLVNGKGIPSRHQCDPVKVAHPVSGQEITLSCHVEDNGQWTYSYLFSSEYADGPRSALVEPGKVFVVSDNRHIHKDSRDFGQVDVSTCEHIVFRLWGDSFVDGKRRFTVLY
jgi:signal peptidase I